MVTIVRTDSVTALLNHLWYQPLQMHWLHKDNHFYFSFSVHYTATTTLPLLLPIHQKLIIVNSICKYQKLLEVSIIMRGQA